MKNRRFITVFVLMVLAVSLPLAGEAYAEYSFSNDPDAVEKAADSVFLLEIYDAHNRKIASGSGFVIFQPSIMVTNYHVIEDAAYVIAVSDDSDKYFIDEVCISDKKAGPCRAPVRAVQRRASFGLRRGG